MNILDAITPLTWILFLIGLIILIIWYFRPASNKSPEETPLEKLKKKYAKGELTKKEYEKQKKELTGK
ncbi:Uncharacterised protein [uncultured archaeon]|nr:Uncharacterised protein [uncultured archaeon]